MRLLIAFLAVSAVSRTLCQNVGDTQPNRQVNQTYQAEPVIQQLQGLGPGQSGYYYSGVGLPAPVFNAYNLSVAQNSVNSYNANQRLPYQPRVQNAPVTQQFQPQHRFQLNPKYPTQTTNYQVNKAVQQAASPVPMQRNRQPIQTYTQNQGLSRAGNQQSQVYQFPSIQNQQQFHHQPNVQQYHQVQSQNIQRPQQAFDKNEYYKQQSFQTATQPKPSSYNQQTQIRPGSSQSEIQNQLNLHPIYQSNRQTNDVSNSQQEYNRQSAYQINRIQEHIQTTTPSQDLKPTSSSKQNSQIPSYVDQSYTRQPDSSDEPFYNHQLNNGAAIKPASQLVDHNSQQSSFNHVENPVNDGFEPNVHRVAQNEQPPNQVFKVVEVSKPNNDDLFPINEDVQRDFKARTSPEKNKNSQGVEIQRVPIKIRLQGSFNHNGRTAPLRLQDGIEGRITGQKERMQIVAQDQREQDYLTKYSKNDDDETSNFFLESSRIPTLHSDRIHSNLHEQEKSLRKDQPQSNLRDQQRGKTAFSQQNLRNRGSSVNTQRVHSPSSFVPRNDEESQVSPIFLNNHKPISQDLNLQNFHKNAQIPKTLNPANSQDKENLPVQHEINHNLEQNEQYNYNRQKIDGNFLGNLNTQNQNNFDATPEQGYQRDTNGKSRVVVRVRPRVVQRKEERKNNENTESTTVPDINASIPNKFNVRPNLGRPNKQNIQQIIMEDTKEEFDEDTPEGLARKQAANARYSFQTSFNDTINDNSQSRQEYRDGLALKGQYSYSDGYYKRTVHYVADEKGYRIVQEHSEPIGDGPQIDPEGQVDLKANFNGRELKYTVTADELPSRT